MRDDSTHPGLSSDDQWLEELQKALEEQAAVPRGVVDSAYQVYAWRTLDAELAELTSDSFADDHAMAGARSDVRYGPRELTFTSTALTIELQVAASVLGQVVPPRAGQVEILLQDGSAEVHDVDEVGRFAIEPTPVQPFRLRVTAGATVATGWITP
jgi:hypothetical protein